MVTLALDGRMGASGDMLLGALVAAGADPSVLDTVESQLNISYEITDVTRCGIDATSVEVHVADERATDEGSHDEQQNNDHSGDSQNEGGHDGHTHGHGPSDHSHAETHDHGNGDHTHGPAEGAGPHRTYPEVVSVVEAMGLPRVVEADALEIFELLGEAESNVHGTTLEATHFHEVGADDAIADIVGVCLLLDDLGVERVVTTPVAVGGGTVTMSHGSYPVPPPAVVELAESADWSVRGGPVETELLTPTGAAILSHYAVGVETLPTLDIETVGYGAGSKSFDSHPNVLRALVGHQEGGLSREPITVLETHVDDTTPEVLGGLSETLEAAGALDVTVVPATMKKSRPGHLIKVVTAPDDASRVARELARETGTLGVREHGRGHRFVADRHVESVSLEIDGEQFDVDVKIATFSGDGETASGIFDVSCEYDHARAVAASTDVSTRDVLRRAEETARLSLDSEP